jgi:diaminopimelate decarboxylase
MSTSNSSHAPNLAKKVPFQTSLVDKIKKAGFPTPFYIYDEAGIESAAQALNQTFAWANTQGNGYQNHFAVKATPTDAIVKLLKAQGHGTDCSSLPELVLSQAVGICGENVIFTSNDTPENEFREAARLGAIINFDDITHIDTYLQAMAHSSEFRIPKIACFRWNPGSLKASETASIIGNPESTKFGVTTEQLAGAYQRLKDMGVTRFGIHTMVGSNMLETAYLVDTADLLFRKVHELSTKLDINFEFANLGGGFGIPYKANQSPVKLQEVSAGIEFAYLKHISGKYLAPLKIRTECGRFVTGPHGYLVGTVKHIAEKYKTFVGLDTGINNLLRSGIYESAYHEAVVLDKMHLPATHTYSITGSLCEGNDVLAANRLLPEITRGDYVVLCDAGAHGHAMHYYYNGKLPCAEFLLRKDGSVELIRHAVTIEDYRKPIVREKEDTVIIR